MAEVPIGPVNRNTEKSANKFKGRKVPLDTSYSTLERKVNMKSPTREFLYLDS